MFLVAFVLFSKDPFEPTRLFFSNQLISELRLVIYEELLPAAITPESAHFLEPRGFLFALTLLFIATAFIY